MAEYLHKEFYVKINKTHISYFFLILTGLVMFAHAIVPHQHHFELYSTPSDNHSKHSTPINQEEQPDTYCHALNILTTARTETQAVNVTSLLKDIDFPYTIEDVEYPIFEYLTVFRLDKNPKQAKQIFINARSLRAPPTC